MIDPKLLDYIEQHSSEEPELLQRLRRETHLKTVYPQMLSGPVMGRFLMMISKILQPTHILEIGTFTGYSAICLADGLKSGGKIHTIESNPEMVAMATRYFRLAGINDKVQQYEGDALKILPKLESDFDLVFIDAAKDQYVDYYQLVLPKLRPGGIILADNVLWDGKVIQEGAPDKDTGGIIRFNEWVRNDGQVEKVLLPLRDGILMIRKL